MKVTKTVQRNMIKSQCAKGSTARQCHQELKNTCGEAALPYRTVARWMKKFKEGRESVKDEPRPGRPANSKEKVKTVCALLKTDGRRTLRELAHIAGLSHTSVQRIAKQHLGMQRIPSTSNHIELNEFNFCSGEEESILPETDVKIDDLTDWMSGNLSPIDSGHSELQADQTVIKTEDTETMLPNEYCLPQLDLADPLATEKESSGTSSFYPLQESSTNFPTAASIAVKNVSKGLVSPAVPNASVKSIYLLEHSKNEEKPLVECEVSGDLVNKQSKFDSTLPDAKKIDVALRTMEEVYDKVNQLSERGDCFDDFGRYVASLLRSFPSGRAKELQQKVIGLILKSHPDQRISSLHDSDSPLIESVKINSAPIIKTTETVEVAQPSSQILGFQKHVSVTTKSTSQLTFPTQKLVAKKIPLTSDKASSKLVNKFDHVLEETEQINATFKRLEDISNKVNQLNKRDNYFENFGRYIISLLSSLPTQRAMKLQHKVINLILSSHINLIVA